MATTDETLAAAISAFEELLFKKFDRLHAAEIHDNDVIRYLRAEGLTILAGRYIEWAGAIDPDVDPTPQGEELVTDPGNAPSYGALEQHFDGGIAPGARLGIEWPV